YGGRQTAMAAAERAGLADALLLLSYPLHPPNKPDRMRTSFFPDWRVPALFVHGSADGFGSLAEMEEAIQLIPARVALMPVNRGGHDLKPAGEMAAAILARLKEIAN